MTVFYYCIVVLYFIDPPIRLQSRGHYNCQICPYVCPYVHSSVCLFVDQKNQREVAIELTACRPTDIQTYENEEDEDDEDNEEDEEEVDEEVEEDEEDGEDGEDEEDEDDEDDKEVVEDEVD